MKPKIVKRSAEPRPNQASTMGDRLSDDDRVLLFQRLNGLRDKLLDLSNRNRLLSFKHSERSRTHVRLIDELPDVLFAKLKDGQKLRFKALPEPESKPLDEETDEFLMALEGARATDATYRSALRDLGFGDGRSEREAEVERRLRDRVRESLGMPPWKDQSGLSKQDLARTEGLEPSYDVPIPRGNDPDEEDRHLDDEVQTLLFPREMDRKLSGIRDQARTMHQEAGVNTLYLALGFLEWHEAQQSEKKHYSPLLLLPVSLEYRKGQPWGHYSLFSDQADVETNKTLEMRLERDFGFEMPLFETDDTPETFLQKIIEATDDQPNWSVRRFLTVGNFGFSKLAMFNDLALENWPTERSLSSLPLVQKMLLGVQEEDSSIIYAPDYEIDSPEIETKDVTLVADADASQHSAIVDAIDGKNLVIKGPPGTGKSQTITNIIAAALAKEKSILFVSEKMAALEVVEARLRDAQLTDFCLQVHSSKTSKLEVLESLRQRLELQEKIPEPRLIDTKLEELRSTRNDLNRYVSTINTSFGAMSLTVQQVLWGYQRAKIEGSEACTLVHDLDFEDAEKVTFLQRNQAHHAIEAAFKRVSEIANRYGSINQHPWYWLRYDSLDPFEIERLTSITRQWHQALQHVSNRVETFVQRYGPLGNTSTRQLNEAVSKISELPVHSEPFVVTLAAAISELGLVDTSMELLKLLSEPEDGNAGTAPILPSDALAPVSSDWLERTDRVSDSLETIRKHSSGIYSIAKAQEEITNLNRNADRLSKLAAITRQMQSVAGSSVGVTHRSVVNTLTALRLLREASREVLLHRGPSLTEEVVEIPLNRAIEKARDLTEIRRSLEELAVLQPLPSLDDVFAHTAALRGAGALSLLSNDIRKAKRFFRRLAKNPRQMSVPDMIGLGTSLCDYLDRRNQLECDPHLKSACDKWFEGAETNFELLLHVSRWQRKVCQRLSGSDGGDDLQSLLLIGTVDDLSALAAGAESIPIENAQRLVDGLADLDRNFERVHDLLHERITALSDAVETLVNQGFGPNAPFRCIAEFARLQAQLEPLRVRLERTPDVPSITATLLLEALDLIDAFSRAALSSDLLSILASSESEPTIGSLRSNIQELSVVLKAEAQQRTDLLDTVGIDLASLTDGKDLDETPVPLLCERLHKAISNPQTLVEHLDLQRALRSARNVTPVNFVEQLVVDPPESSQVRSAYDWLLYRSLAKSAFKRDPTLAEFKGLDLQEVRKRFQELDREILALERQRIGSKLCARPIPQGNGVGRVSTYTDLALIRRESTKRKRHIPLRQLFLRAPKAIRAMKPCFMMSPLSVATYLKAGQFEFDLAVIDEASQMPLEDALGVLARAKQIIVVGDPMQLPPTSFFKRFDDIMDDEEDEEDEDLDVESVLDQAYNIFRPPRELHWHYRSRHQSLIAFSNRQFYDNGLTIFPSYIDKHEHYGVKLIQVEGCYADRHNPIEAKQIAAWAREFMKTRPDESLGLVAMNQLQRDILVDEMDRIFQRDSLADAYRRKWDGTLYPFFVKNLENVQGDERDVIAISLVYGPNADGRLTNNFGPISKRNGERRLNVLFTRARNQLALFSSITPDQIRISESTLRGPRILRSYLDYALTGRLDSGVETDRLPDSDFEVFVADRLRSYGYEVVPQVGVAGYFIDLGIRHYEFPEIFLVGVECDGATYHSSKSARDRDRLREEVLEGLGWKLYRIWSSDWFRDPDKEVNKLCHFIELAAEERRDLMRRPAPSIEELLPIDQAEELIDFDEVSDETDGFILREAEVAEEEKEGLQDDDKSVAEVHEGFEEAVELEAPIRAPAVTVEVGDTVTFHFDDKSEERHRVTIVAGMSDAEQDYISRDSPIGYALLDTTVGDEAEIEAPGGTRVAIVDFIEKPPPSDDQPPHPTQPDGTGNKEADGGIRLREHSEAAADRRPNASRTAADGEMYQPWKMRALPDPRNTSQGDVARHLREIIAAEGPVRVNRAYQIYARACGINRVGRMVRSKLNSALYSLVRRKDVLLEKEGPDDSQINAIARLNGASRVIVRSAGPRTFWDIPPSELATVMSEERTASPGSGPEEIYRRVLVRYEVGRLTSGIRSELLRIDRVSAERHPTAS